MSKYTNDAPKDRAWKVTGHANVFFKPRDQDDQAVMAYIEHVAVNNQISVDRAVACLARAFHVVVTTGQIPETIVPPSRFGEDTIVVNLAASVLSSEQ